MKGVWIKLRQLIFQNEKENILDLKAVLFDLDNTLILFNESDFFKVYSYRLSQYFIDMMNFEEFTQRLIGATQVMVNNNGDQSNLDLFMDAFTSGTNNDKDEQLERFQSFYDTQFDQFRTLMTPVSGAQNLILNLQARQFKTVIASNPMFPMNVQQKRISWANIEDIPFNLITSVDNSSFCKPRLEYYEEICHKIGTHPEHCLMVGNDAFNDMIASKLGMKTYLTTDCDDNSFEMSKQMAKNFNMEIPEPDFEGPLSHLMDTIFPQ